MAFYDEGLVSVEETPDGPQFKFNSERIEIVAGALALRGEHKEKRLHEMGISVGRDVMRRLLPAGTIGDTVDIIYSMMETMKERDPATYGIGPPITMTTFLGGGVIGALGAISDFKD